MASNTANYGLIKPAVNNPTDQDLWGGYLNTDLDSIDGLLKTAINTVSSVKTDNYTTVLADNKKLLEIDASTGAKTISLLSAATAGNGAGLILKKIDTTVNAVSIDPSGTETIDGATVFALTKTNDSVVIVSDGTNWKIVADTLTRITSLKTFISGSSGNFATPDNIDTNTVFKFILTGGGGSGGNSPGGNSAAGGGGAGSTAIFYVAGLSPSTNYPYTIGSGAAAGSVSAGGASSITINGITYNCGGGASGENGSGSNGSAALGGLGGSIAISGGTNSNLIDVPGGDGINSSINANTSAAGNGGPSYWGGGGRGGNQRNTGGQNGGRAYGSGGGGGVSNSTAGAAGAGGIIYVEWMS